MTAKMQKQIADWSADMYKRGVHPLQIAERESGIMKFEMTQKDFEIVRRALAIAHKHEMDLNTKALQVMPEASANFINSAIAIREVDTSLANQFMLMNKEERKS